MDPSKGLNRQSYGERLAKEASCTSYKRFEKRLIGP